MPATRSVREILLTAAPLGLAVFVFGVSFGVLAIAARFPGWAAVLMSALVFAGSAQFAALGVITAGGSAVTAVRARGVAQPPYIATRVAVGPWLPGRPLGPAPARQPVGRGGHPVAAGARRAGRP